MTGPVPAARASGSPWQRWGWLVAGVWLVFLVYPVIEVFQTDAPVWAKTGALLMIAAFAVVYLLGFSVLDAQALTIWFVMLALASATASVIGVEAVGLTPYLGAFAALLVPAPWWRWAVLFSALLPLLSLLGGNFPAFFFLVVWPLIGFCVALRVFAEIDRRAESLRAEMALVSERDRVARDVHDVLGHSLTVLSVKAELASRLLDVDPARARAELDSIQATARDALAQVRSTVGGLRSSDLAVELETAPRLLTDAGVEAHIDGSVTDTDPRHRALLGWVLRESLTNVVRHAEASHTWIELAPDGLVVADDGRGTTGVESNGLRGMRERVSAAGGTLTVTNAHPGTRVEVRLP